MFGCNVNYRLRYLHPLFIYPSQIIKQPLFWVFIAHKSRYFSNELGHVKDEDKSSILNSG